MTSDDLSWGARMLPGSICFAGFLNPGIVAMQHLLCRKCVGITEKAPKAIPPMEDPEMPEHGQDWLRQCSECAATCCPSARVLLYLNGRADRLRRCASAHPFATDGRAQRGLGPSKTHTHILMYCCGVPQICGNGSDWLRQCATARPCSSAGRAWGGLGASTTALGAHSCCKSQAAAAPAAYCELLDQQD
eukprot:1158933-Pelagomonas_calceolata.AAC.4